MITVAPGTEDATRVRLKGQGPKGSGDLVVQFQIEPDRFFRREGAITGMDDWQMSRVILRVKPEVFEQLHGGNIAAWPSFVDPRWSARRKHW